MIEIEAIISHVVPQDDPDGKWARVISEGPGRDGKWVRIISEGPGRN